MIERVKTQNGQCVLKSDGRLMSSRFDPQGEAKAWLERRKIFIDKVKTIIILGAGSGYHVVEALESTAAQIIVVDPSQSLIDLVNEIHRFDTRRVQFECCKTAKELRACESVRKSIESSFVVLLHPASREGREKVFKELQDQLGGRDWGSLTWQWQLQGLGDLETNPRITNEKLTIYDLEQAELVQNSEERETLLIKALRELVK